jgi:GTPase SAR1 family protein
MKWLNILGWFSKFFKKKNVEQEQSIASPPKMLPQKTTADETERPLSFQPAGGPMPTGDAYLDSLRAQITEKDGQIKKLKAEIDVLTDKADETEDDAKNYKKKLEGAKKEFEDFKNQYRELENEYNSIKQERDNLALKSQEIKDDLDIKDQSLRFVGEILNAQNADNRDAVEINEKTQHVVDFVQGEVCETLRETSGLSMGDLDGFQADIEKWGNLERKIWLKGKTIIAFVGEFSAGKTSIVNRILTQDANNSAFLLPVSSAPTTAIPTYISFARDTVVQFTDSNEDLKNMKIESFMQFSKAKLEKVNVSKLVRHFVIGYNNEHLKNLSVLDTPGFSSNDKEDERRTAEVVREADALFWVVDAHTGEINERSVQIIKEHMRDMPLYIVINKVDGKSPNERGQILEKVKQTMEKNSIPVIDFIEFSKSEPIANIMNPVQDIEPKKEDSDILNTLRNCIDALIKKYEDEVKIEQQRVRDCTKAINDADAEIEDKNRSGERNIAEYIANINEMKEGIGKTLFGRDNKIKNPERFWELFDRQPEIFDEFTDILSNVHEAIFQKSDYESNKNEAVQNLNDYAVSIKNLKAILGKFNELVRPFENS